MCMYDMFLLFTNTYIHILSIYIYMYVYLPGPGDPTPRPWYGPPPLQPKPLKSANSRMDGAPRGRDRRNCHPF